MQPKVTILQHNIKQPLGFFNIESDNFRLKIDLKRISIF